MLNKSCKLFFFISSDSQSLSQGTVLIGTVYYDASAQLSSIYAYLDSLNITVRDVTYGGKFAFAIIKGSSTRTVLAKNSANKPMLFGIDVYGKDWMFWERHDLVGDVIEDYLFGC